MISIARSNLFFGYADLYGVNEMPYSPQTYDQWKTTDPRDYEPEEEEDYCDHPDYEVDSEGRAHCCSCPHVWWQTADEIAAERRCQDDYDRYIAHYMRWDWLRSRWRKVIGLFWHPKETDEIPF